MNELADGSYDALVVDVETDDDGVVHVELTITTGPHKGELVTLRASSMKGDPLSLLATPATLIIDAGQPRLVLD